MDQYRAFKTHQPVCLNKTTSFPWVPSTLLEIYITIVDPGTSRISDPPRSQHFHLSQGVCIIDLTGFRRGVGPNSVRLKTHIFPTFFWANSQILPQLCNPKVILIPSTWSARQFFCLSLVLLRSFVLIFLMDNGGRRSQHSEYRFGAVVGRRLGGCGTFVREVIKIIPSPYY